MDPITMPVHIGEGRLPSDFARYAKRFSFLELDSEPGKVPAKARLRACAEQAPEGFVFSLIVPAVVASLEGGDAALEALKRANALANMLDARWWVVRTPALVRPTRRTREQLGELFTRLRDGGRRIAWEPRGLWEDAAASETALELGAHLVRDVAQQAPPPASTLYARILALGRGTRVGLGLAAAVADRLRDIDEAFVVVEGRGAQELQRAVLAAAAEPLAATAPLVAGPIRPAPRDEDADEDDLDEDEDDLDEDDLTSGEDIEGDDDLVGKDDELDPDEDDDDDDDDDLDADDDDLDDDDDDLDDDDDDVDLDADDEDEDDDDDDEPDEDEKLVEGDDRPRRSKE
jgi:hypothetical protein